jgi:hypothetical protein
MGLTAHATAFYTLANGKVSDPVPLAEQFRGISRYDLRQGKLLCGRRASRAKARC